MKLAVTAAAAVATLALTTGTASAQYPALVPHRGHYHVAPAYSPPVVGGYVSPGFGVGGSYTTPGYGLGGYYGRPAPVYSGYGWGGYSPHHHHGHGHSHGHR